MAQSKPEDIEYRLRLKWGSVFQYTTRQHSCDDIASENYFKNISQRYFQSGDEIHVSVLTESDKIWYKGVFEVLVSDLETCIVRQIEPWTDNIPKKAPEKKKAAA